GGGAGVVVERLEDPHRFLEGVLVELVERPVGRATDHATGVERPVGVDVRDVLDAHHDPHRCWLLRRAGMSSWQATVTPRARPSPRAAPSAWRAPGILASHSWGLKNGAS